MEIEIQKVKAIKREKIKRWCWLIMGTIIWFLLLNGIFNFLQLMNLDNNLGWKISYLLYSFIFMSLWEYVSYRFFLIEVKTLQCSIDEKENRLISKWKVILKHKNTAKLQVINSVDIDQDIWDKFVDLHHITVSYGFADSGYDYYFYYLTEEEAEKVASKIKPSGRIGVDLK